MNRFPIILTALRKERKLSQKVVALDLNISQSLLSHYEKGVRECSLDMLIAIADYYGVSCDYLLGCSEVRGRSVNNGSDIETMRDCMSNVMNTVIETGDKKLIDAVEKYITLSMYNLVTTLNFKAPSKNKAKTHLSFEISELMQKNQLYNISKLSTDFTKNKECAPSIASTIELSEKYFTEFINEFRL